MARSYGARPPGLTRRQMRRLGQTGRVPRRLLALSALGAALTANGLRPFPDGTPLAVPSFFAGWLTSELAPHNLAVTVGGSTAYLARRRGRLDRDDKVALALNGLSVLGLLWLIQQGLASRYLVERALTEGLHDDYVARLDPQPDETDLTTPW